MKHGHTNASYLRVTGLLALSGGRGDTDNLARDNLVRLDNGSTLVSELLDEGVKAVLIDEGEAHPLLVADGAEAEEARATEAGASAGGDERGGEAAATGAADTVGGAMADGGSAAHAAAVGAEHAVGEDGEAGAGLLELGSPVTVEVGDGGHVHNPAEARHGDVGLDVVVVDTVEGVLGQRVVVADHARHGGADRHGEVETPEAVLGNGGIVDEGGRLAGSVSGSDGGRLGVHDSVTELLADVSRVIGGVVGGVLHALELGVVHCVRLRQDKMRKGWVVVGEISRHEAWIGRAVNRDWGSKMKSDGKCEWRTSWNIKRQKL